MSSSLSSSNRHQRFVRSSWPRAGRRRPPTSIPLQGCLRFAVDVAVSRRAGGAFPAGTLAVNLSGAVVLGLISGLALRGDARLLAGTALIGSYTTFST